MLTNITVNKIGTPISKSIRRRKVLSVLNCVTNRDRVVSGFFTEPLVFKKVPHKGGQTLYVHYPNCNDTQYTALVVELDCVELF